MVFAITLGVGLVLCSGIITLSYLAIQKAAGFRQNVDLPAEMPSRSDDRVAFNESLAIFLDDPTMDPCIDPEICEYVRTSLNQLRSSQPISFSREMFLKAVAASPVGKGEIGLVERLTINNWLIEYEPTPSIDEDHSRILNIRINDRSDLAIVDLLVYSADNQAMSQQWYLVKENETWKMYDWQRLEYGRRMSDEYAGYVIADTPDADGYDLAMQELAEAQNLWWNGEQVLAVSKIRKCETTPMLPSDRKVGLLRTAYTWTAIDQNNEAIRVLKKIAQPDELWGVWPMLAACYLNSGQKELALAAALRAEAQSPNHPNVHWLLSQFDNQPAAVLSPADHLVKALQICPHDTTCLTAAIETNRTEDIPLILDCMLLSDDPLVWSRVLDHAAQSTTWGQELQKTAAKQDDLPKGFAILADANVAWSRADYDRAAELFLQARDETNTEMLREIAAQDHLLARLENDRVLELIREADSVEDVFARLSQQAFDEALRIPPETILEAIEKTDTENSIWARGLRGNANYTLGRYDLARPDLEDFCSWLITQRAVKESENKFPDWITEVAESQLTDVLIQLDQSMGVLKRWPNDLDRHHQWGTLLLRRNNDDKRRKVIAALKDKVPDSIEVQRSRFAAREARIRGDAKVCDQHHRDAIKLWKTLNDDDLVSKVQTLTSERARDAVWNRLPGPPENNATSENDAFSERFLTVAAQEAKTLNDEQTLRQWIDYATEQGVKTGDTYCTLQTTYGDLLREQGKFKMAAQAYLAAISQQSDNDTWISDRRRQHYIDSMLQSNEQDALLAWLKVDGQLAIWDRATVELANGNGQQLISLLGKVPVGQVSAWLESSQQRAALERYSDQKWIDELLAKYPIELGYVSAQASGDLVINQRNLPQADQMLQWVKQATGSSTEPLKVGFKDDQRHAWVVNLDDGQRYAIGFEITQFKQSNLPKQIQPTFAQPILRIAIHVLDHHPHATRRLFAAACRLADENSVAFQWNNEGLLWSGEDLARSLAWENRVPMTKTLGRFRLLPTPNLDKVDEKEPKLVRWAATLQSADEGKAPIFVRRSVLSIKEKVPAQLIGANLDEYYLEVQLEADSSLDPLAKSGRRFQCGAINIGERPPRPETATPLID